MKISLFIILFFAGAKNMNAQDVSGEYYLEGVMETASGFQLSSDSGFQFFFSYGALDRSGKGKWVLRADSVIVLNSDKRPPLDFKLEKQISTSEKFIIIQVEDKNSNILRYVQGFIKSGLEEKPFEVNTDGIAKLDSQSIDSIGVIFTLCPDRYSVFPVNKENNYFVFRFEPWIADVFFENFALKYTDGILTGQHPLLKGNDYNYKKE